MRRRKTRGEATPESLDRFIGSLAASGNVTEASRRAHLSRSRVYSLRQEDAAFARRWDDAMETAADALECEARRRGLEGWDEPVWHKGHQVGVIRKFSDKMLEIMLKAARPERFRERHSHAFDSTPDPFGENQTQVDTLMAQMPPELKTAIGDWARGETKRPPSKALH